jgi:tetratricopeptide (TPR) repeat protein
MSSLICSSRMFSWLVRSIAVLSLPLAVLLAPRETHAQRENADAALREFEAGAAAYEVGDFEVALGHFRRGYELTPSPAFLYNIATALDRLRRDEEALSAYEEYAERFPDAEDHANVVARVRILREALARREAPPTVEAHVIAPDETPEEGSAGDAAPPDETMTAAPHAAPLTVDEGPGAAPFLVASAGGLVAVAGGVFLVLAAMDTSAVENATVWADVRDAYDRVPTFQTVGGVLLGVGGAALAAGLVWAIAGGGGGSREETLALRVGPSSVSLEGTF